MTYEEVIRFWFKEISSSQMWGKDPEFDSLIRERFLPTLLAANQGELFSWRKKPEGRLAEIIVLDQFSRNIFRNQPESFASDSLALVLAQEAVFHGYDKDIPSDRVSFLYMPYMHSESLRIHEQAVQLFSEPHLKGSLEFELKHKKIIEKFGRYPHRNKILGRVSTPVEIEFLKGPGSSF